MSSNIYLTKYNFIYKKDNDFIFFFYFVFLYNFFWLSLLSSLIKNFLLGFWHITSLESHIFCMYQFFHHQIWLVCFFFLLVLLFLLCFSIKIISVFLLSNFVFQYFWIYEFREFVYMYLDNELKFFYKIIN